MWLHQSLFNVLQAVVLFKFLPPAPTLTLPSDIFPNEGNFFLRYFKTTPKLNKGFTDLLCRLALLQERSENPISNYAKRIDSETTKISRCLGIRILVQ